MRRTAAADNARRCSVPSSHFLGGRRGLRGDARLALNHEGRRLTIRCRRGRGGRRLARAAAHQRVPVASAPAPPQLLRERSRRRDGTPGLQPPRPPYMCGRRCRRWTHRMWSYQSRLTWPLQGTLQSALHGTGHLPGGQNMERQQNIGQSDCHDGRARVLIFLAGMGR
eukprot:COSAG04_NODE_848_length_9881_cov_5.280822_9_plen_168_part_00